jgi:hypothetical protein
VVHQTKPAALPERIEDDEILQQGAGDHTVQKALGDPARLDAESAEWLQVLADTGPRREAALARLHERLLRIARKEAARRAPRLAISGPELDDVAHQAAADALLAITAKIGQFRGESRFTTWAYKFVVFEVSAKIGHREYSERHSHWRVSFQVKRHGGPFARCPFTSVASRPVSYLFLGRHAG